MPLSMEGAELGTRLLIDGVDAGVHPVETVRKYFDEHVLALSDESLNMLMMVICSLMLREPVMQEQLVKHD